MATLGLCSYCEQVAEENCRMCGRVVCPDHQDGETPQVCLVCARGALMAGRGSTTVEG